MATLNSPPLEIGRASIAQLIEELEAGRATSKQLVEVCLSLSR
jgi:hypothetical protein